MSTSKEIWKASPTLVNSQGSPNCSRTIPVQQHSQLYATKLLRRFSKSHCMLQSVQALEREATDATKLLERDSFRPAPEKETPKTRKTSDVKIICWKLKHRCLAATNVALARHRHDTVLEIEGRKKWSVSHRDAAGSVVRSTGYSICAGTLSCLQEWKAAYSGHSRKSGSNNCLPSESPSPKMPVVGKYRKDRAGVV